MEKGLASPIPPPNRARLELVPPHLGVDIEQDKVVPTRQKEVHASIVSMNHFVLWPVEDSIVDRQHGSDGEDLLCAFVPEKPRKDVMRGTAMVLGAGSLAMKSPA